MERNAVLDGDLVFLHGQEREMRKPEYQWSENIDRVSIAKKSRPLFGWLLTCA